MNKNALIIVGLCLGWAWMQDDICHHSVRGRTKRISLDRVEAAQMEVRKRLSRAIGRIERLTPGSSFDSGLPACRRRRTHPVRGSFPRTLVGRTIAFGPDEDLPEGDIRVATSVDQLMKLRADALAHPAIVRRLGLRCTPTQVRIRSEDRLELLENP